jgi:hypothetical protein
MQAFFLISKQLILRTFAARFRHARSDSLYRHGAEVIAKSILCQ